MREKVTLLRELGYTDEEIRSIISKFISPLRTIQNQIEINDLFLIEDKDDE